MTSLDEDHEGETPGYASFRQNFSHLTKFLWMATRNVLQKVPYVLSDTTKVQEWAERVHLGYLEPKIQFKSKSHGNLKYSHTPRCHVIV